jgi:hypothetical protein
MRGLQAECRTQRRMARLTRGLREDGLTRDPQGECRTRRREAVCLTHNLAVNLTRDLRVCLTLALQGPNRRQARICEAL